ncbi:hypothetical protein [Bradyrhizobium sp.]
MVPPADHAGAILLFQVVGLADGGTEIGAAIGHRQRDHLGADCDPRLA